MTGTITVYWVLGASNVMTETHGRWLPLPERDTNMEQRGLYRVITVDPEKATIEIDELVVANDEASAKLKVLRDAVGDFDDFDIIVIRLGNVRPKRRPQEVKIIDK